MTTNTINAIKTAIPYMNLNGLSGLLDKLENIADADFTIEEKNKLASLAAVALSGSYNDLTDKPTVAGLNIEPIPDSFIDNLFQ